jgi:uncharacterized protein (DUF362 family)
MLNRRRFIRSVLAGVPVLALGPKRMLAGIRSSASMYFDVHPFIDANPSAVFILRTAVDTKTNAEAITQVGYAFGSTVFVPATTAGIPLTHRVVIKPNIVMMPGISEQYMGMVTDPHFVEGVIESIKTLGMAGGQFYIREVSNPDQFGNSGYEAMAARTGADLRALNAPIGELPESEIHWMDVPDGKWFKKIAHLQPIHEPDTILLNIAKMKTHMMGMSLCAKNLQGTNVVPFVHYCKRYGEDMEIAAEYLQPDGAAQILADYQRHRAAGIPRWDRPGDEGGIWLETWAARCLDNNSVLHPRLNIIEAVYGREGPFLYGPGAHGEAIDHMTNMIIFGKNAFHVDVIGHWLGGHEPGNFGLFHLAVERGLAGTLNPHDVPLFEWNPDGTYARASLDHFPRFALRTQYLRRDYDGQQEPDWHLVNEHYSYTRTVTKTIAVSSGWNLVSLPADVLDPTVTSQFPGASSSAFAFDNGYFPAEVLNPGKGYWLKFPDAANLPVTGSQVSTREIPLGRGWNIVGPFELDMPTASIQTIPEGILSSDFFGYQHGYAVAQVLECGKGYWVKADQPGVITPPSGSPQRVPTDVAVRTDLVHIHLGDSGGHAATLYLGPGREENAALPPVPPSGVFDVRFSGDRYVAPMDTAQNILLSSIAYPLTISATNLGGRRVRIHDGLGGELVNVLLEEGRSVTIAHRLVQVSVSLDEPIVKEYALEQNYPNPFNGTTGIRYSLPLNAHVVMSVFNALGQHVATLVDEPLSAGTHEVRFDASGLPSGTYFYRLWVGALREGSASPGRDDPGKFVATRRMVLVR